MQDDPGRSEWPDDPEGSGPWSELTDDLVSLTDRLRGTYREIADDNGPTEDEVREAFNTLAGAWNQMAGAVGMAIQDEQVRHHLKKAAGSLVNAVSASLSEFMPGEGAASEEDDEEDPAKSDVTYEGP